MSEIQNEINRIKENVVEAYSVVEEKGGILPDTQNTNNLADAIRSIKSGDTIAQMFNAPVGTIAIWSGAESTIPTGWHICDGEEGTIDLRDKFVLGAGEKHNPGEIGGSEEVALTVGQMPKHNHLQQAVTDSGQTFNAVDNGANPLSMYKNTSTGDAGSSQPHPNMPPYYALYFIQKLSETPTDYVTEKRVDEKIEEALEGYEPGGGSGNPSEPIEWGDINGRPDLSNVSKLDRLPITIPVYLWGKDNWATVPVKDLPSEDPAGLIIPIPTSESKSVYYSCDIMLVDQGEGNLTFEAETVPEEDVDVYIYLQSAAELENEYTGDF